MQRSVVLTLLQIIWGKEKGLLRLWGGDSCESALPVSLNWAALFISAVSDSASSKQPQFAFTEVLVH